jgi:retron-type reverse transcriptase
MAKGTSKSAVGNWKTRRTPVKTDELALALFRAESRVLEIQTKLHRWARQEPPRRFEGIATITDRVVQASLKLVLEPIFEADFYPCSYGFRPNHRTHDAVAEVRFLASKSYEWIVEGDIKACFDEISHSALLGRVRQRVGDKRVLALVKAFLKAGILGEDRLLRENNAGTPQGSILSPLL